MVLVLLKLLSSEVDHLLGILVMASAMALSSPFCIIYWRSPLVCYKNRLIIERLTARAIWRESQYHVAGERLHLPGQCLNVKVLDSKDFFSFAQGWLICITLHHLLEFREPFFQASFLL